MQPVLQPPARLQLSPQEAMLAAIVTDFQCRQTGLWAWIHQQLSLWLGDFPTVLCSLSLPLRLIILCVFC